MNSPPGAVEVRVARLAPYGGPKKAHTFTLPDTVTLEQGLRARKFIRVPDRNWKAKAVFLK
jgi:hypothetical protein